MRYITIFSLILLQNLIAGDAPPTISVPKSVSPCSPVPLEINGGTPPYSVSIVNAVNPTGPALKEFKDVRQPSSLSWGADLPAGAVITFNVQDSKGLTASSGQSSVSQQCQGPNPDLAGSPASNNNFGDKIPNPSPNNTAAPGAGPGANSTNPPGPIPPADGASNAANSSALAPTLPPNPSTGTNGSSNPADLPMNSTSTNSSTPVGPDNATIPANSTAPTPPINSTPLPTPNYPVKNTTQSQGSNVNINNNNKNQTAKPTANRHATSTASKGPPNPFHSVLFITSVVILSTWK